VQRGRDVRVDPPPARGLAPPPLAVLDALHRIYWLAAPAADGSQVDGERIEEWLRDGRVVRRAFRREDDPDAGAVTIEYASPGGVAAASEIEIVNPWCGYQAVFVTL
jgi:hypothetical protein